MKIKAVLVQDVCVSFGSKGRLQQAAQSQEWQEVKVKGGSELEDMQQLLREIILDVCVST